MLIVVPKKYEQSHLPLVAPQINSCTGYKLDPRLPLVEPQANYCTSCDLDPFAELGNEEPPTDLSSEEENCRVRGFMFQYQQPQ